MSAAVGHDEERGDELRAIEFDGAGGKPFDINTAWFTALLDGIGQPSTQLAAAADLQTGRSGR